MRSEQRADRLGELARTLVLDQVGVERVARLEAVQRQPVLDDPAARHKHTRSGRLQMRTQAIQQLLQLLGVLDAADGGGSGIHQQLGDPE